MVTLPGNRIQAVLMRPARERAGDADKATCGLIRLRGQPLHA
jgi:hypothetical protein